MMKVATMDMLYVAADFLFANSTKGERESIFKMVEEGRANQGYTDNNRKLYYEDKVSKKILKRISKNFM
jgi:hypothetical protein